MTFRKTAIAAALFAASGLVMADSLEGVERMVCAAGRAQICLENGECYSTTPWELSMPEFVVIDTKKGVIATTRASGEDRSTQFSKSERVDGVIYLQGTEDGRAFSLVIHEATGKLTVAVARDGLTVTVFGACTDAKL